MAECPAHSGVCNEVENLKRTDKDQWDAINELRNRLPVWATLVISILTGLLGFVLGIATILARRP
jgi:hypothetical protein